VTVLLGGPAGRPDAAVAAGFELVFLSGDGVEQRVPLDEAWRVPVEDGLPVRRFTARKGQRHLSGLWWSATTGGHVGYESWLERDHLLGLDFDPAVVGIASQPFWLRWSDGSGRRVSHAPDYFVRRADGSAVVIDCRPVERRGPRDLARFEATAAACGLLGWQYRLVGAVDPVVTANLRWLAGYRHSRYRLAGTVAGLLDSFAGPRPLLAGVERVGDPLAVLPVLFHLLWCQELSVDLRMPLHERAVVQAGARP
jgi:hypothetical protein